MHTVCVDYTIQKLYWGYWGKIYIIYKSIFVFLEGREYKVYMTSKKKQCASAVLNKVFDKSK